MRTPLLLALAFAVMLAGFAGASWLSDLEDEWEDEWEEIEDHWYLYPPPIIPFYYGNYYGRYYNGNYYGNNYYYGNYYGGSYYSGRSYYDNYYPRYSYSFDYQNCGSQPWDVRNRSYCQGQYARQGMYNKGW